GNAVGGLPAGLLPVRGGTPGPGRVAVGRAAGRSAAHAREGAAGAALPGPVVAPRVPAPIRASPAVDGTPAGAVALDLLRGALGSFAGQLPGLLLPAAQSATPEGPRRLRMAVGVHHLPTCFVRDAPAGGRGLRG